MLHNKGTDVYNNNGRDYKAVPYGGLHIQTNTMFFSYDDINLGPILQHYFSCIVLPHLFVELPLTPKTNGQQQATVEPYLERLILAMAEPPKYAMNHGGRKELPLSHLV